ncbi:hypothetical protein FB45DRAFT_5817 [Roridomyces roridus]|uniref:TPR-like protein n=1 Tax=Roridomyces roridus TaxID=1738132 RepID=A0AAD7CIX0_9AGAR|nr:hypothetical protein FB45DRAFT_5817 [Roridomyces roridus]
MTTTTELKTAGNALFSAKQFVAAARKYSEAIRSADESSSIFGSRRELAVLYANRSACWLGIWRFIEACDDASKAAELDPTYAKAWARLATAKDALGSHSESLPAWKHALDLLPPDSDSNSEAEESQTQQQQRAQYQAHYDAAAASVARLKKLHVVSGEQTMMMMEFMGQAGEGRMPWDLAARMLPALRVQRPMNRTSSAWVIHYAYEDFMTGIRKMRLLYDDPATNMRGVPQSFVDISNGLLRDTRTMHLLNDEFMKQYDGQLRLEMWSTRPWTPWPDADSEVVIQEALERQRSSGWDSVRGSLSLTIRVWIIQAFTEGTLRSQWDISLGYLQRAIKTLRGLQEHWAQADRVDRGVIFEPSFIFGVQKIYLEAMMQACERQSEPFAEEQMLQEADVLISRVDRALRDDPPSDGLDPGFQSSFFAYPRATTFASRGLYYTRKAQREAATTCDGAYGSKSWPLLRWAASEYMQAAGCLPPDEERYCVYLKLAIDNMLSSHLVPLRETLDTMERLRVAIPQAKAIWEYSPLAANGELWDTLQAVAQREDRLRGLVESREVGLDACYGE